MAHYPWFRLYHEARTDPKLATLTDAQFRQWFNLLCLASEQPTRGLIQFRSFRMLALQVTRCTEQEIADTLTILADLEMVEFSDYEVSFINWEKRQFDKPSDTPEATRARQRLKRERDKNNGHAPSRDVTPRHATEEKKKRGEEIRKDDEEDVAQSVQLSSPPSSSPLSDQVQEAAGVHNKTMATFVASYAPRVQKAGLDFVEQAGLWRDKMAAQGKPLAVVSFKAWMDNEIGKPRPTIRASPVALVSKQFQTWDQIQATKRTP